MARQPVHTLYGGAQIFRSHTAPKMGEIALRSLKEHAGDPSSLADVFGLSRALADRVYPRLIEKLGREPVEDFRIDFEDGYGERAWEEEDHHAIASAQQVAEAFSLKLAPPCLGIRIKPLTEEFRFRSLRTLDLFLTTLRGAHGTIPDGFLITLPKITAPEQVAALVDHLAGCGAQSARVEIMIETTEAVLNQRALFAAARGFCVAAHFGAYDYTGSIGVVAAHQDLFHPACDFARNMMQAALSATGIRLADGATNILPVGDRARVHRAWKAHYSNVQRSMRNGFYQSWDLHPAQLVSRYVAVYAFFLDGMEAAVERLKNFEAESSRARRTEDVFDDAATVLGLRNSLQRAQDCGAISVEV